MNISRIIVEELITENKGKNLLLLDIDDTLLKASGIYIHRKLPSDKETVKLTPDEYAKDPNTKSPSNKKYYDYKEFRDPEIVAKSIKLGNPIIPNLQVVDSYVNNGWKIGILTARGLEDIIYDSIKDFLQIRNPKGELEDVGRRISKSLVFAVNDEIRSYEGTTDSEKKKNVILELSKKYDRVWLIDDDDKNIKAVNDLVSDLQSKGDSKTAQKIKAIKAKV